MQRFSCWVIRLMMSSAIDMDVTPKQMSKGNLSGSQK